MKNSSIGLALAFTTACSATPPSTPIPKTAASSMIVVDTVPKPAFPIYIPDPQFHSPSDENELAINFVACAGSIKAQRAYLDVIKKVTGQEEFAPGSIPCEIILQIHTLAQGIVESCNSVQIPLEYDKSNQLLSKQIELMTTQASAATQKALKNIKEIESYEKHCFPQPKTYNL